MWWMIFWIYPIILLLQVNFQVQHPRLFQLLFHHEYQQKCQHLSQPCYQQIIHLFYRLLCQLLCPQVIFIFFWKKNFSGRFVFVFCVCIFASKQSFGDSIYETHSSIRLQNRSFAENFYKTYAIQNYWNLFEESKLDPNVFFS